MNPRALHNSRTILGVLVVAAAVSSLIIFHAAKGVDLKNLPVPSPLTRAESHDRSLVNTSVHTLAGDEANLTGVITDLTNETTTLSKEQTAAAGFEHTEVFNRFVTQQPGNHTDVAEYLASVKAYLVNFTSPMIRRTATEYSWPETEEETRQRQSRSNSSGKAVKRIVWYNCPHHMKRSRSGTLFLPCPVKNCQLSYHYDNHTSADAVVFQKIPGGVVPPRDHDGQVYVFHIMESPANTGSGYQETPWNSAFNWTWNYRLDSDVFTPVGYLRQSQSLPSHSQLLEQMQNKTKMVAWFVSNCNTQSHRKQYVHELRKIVPVDIYGACGWLKCPRRNTTCLSKLNDYFFYLSFENSMCQDYITEKYYKTFHEGVNVLSVVRGGANYSRFFPEGTFIDADWFTGPEELGRYLLALAKDPARYVDLMWRRAHFVYHQHGNVDAYCRLCYKLHHVDRFNKTYTNLHRWNHENKCSNPKPFFNLF